MKTQFLPAVFTIILIVFLIDYISGQSAGQQAAGKKFINARVTEVVRAKIGNGQENIGAISPPEAEAIGPMSFTVSDEGEIYILDQLNSRIQVYRDGKRTETIKIPVKSEGIMDIELLSGAKIALLDNTVEKSLFIIDSQGKLINTIPLEGQLIAYAPEATEINVVREGKFTGVWVRVNGHSVKLADADGKTAMRVSVPGKLTFNSERLLDAKILGDITISLMRSEKGSLSMWEPELTVEFDMFVIHFGGPWDDRSGNIYLSAFMEDSDEQGKSTYSNVMVVFSTAMKETGRIKLAVQKAPYEIFHPVKVSSDGKIYQMIAEKQEIVVLKYEF
ncbi:MAG: hypothetical protein WBJ37_09245 [Bacteroidales bacterium]